MPANLTPQYLAAEQRFKEAESAPEKITALEEMIAVMPKHKGTDRLHADLRRKLAKLRAEASKKHGVSKASAAYAVQKEGAGQIVLVGAANVGKSSLLARLTHATPEIGDYPFTTRLPQPGMIPYKNIKIQLVDMPPMDEHYYEPWMGGIVRQADFLLLVVDLSSDDLLEEVEGVLHILEESRIRLEGKLLTGDDAGGGDALHRCLIIANKLDAPAGLENLGILKEFYEGRFEILAVSAQRGDGIDPLVPALFSRLEVVRIYTKAPGKKVDLGSAPFVLKHGSTVLDLARMVHRDFVDSLKFARAWSSEESRRAVRFDGQMVERTHVLEDGEIIELHV
jgi:uncharacterized protein